jgi:hypothetical protein
MALYTISDTSASENFIFINHALIQLYRRIFFRKSHLQEPKTYKANPIVAANLHSLYYIFFAGYPGVPLITL